MNVKHYTPSQRRLRVFALDPSFSSQLDAARLNEMPVSIRWEKDLRRGPIGKYFEVDDPRHKPVDLNAAVLLAQDGLAPAVGNAQFHQQMVYAVAMRVVENVEEALGRVLLWNPKVKGKAATRSDANCQLRLRLVPHAMKEANAYYSPEEQALIFGYFPAQQFDPSLPAGETIYTCLSHDIIAHELTHVVIHSLLPLSVLYSLDTAAFHEAVSDLVAILQHFELSPFLDDIVSQTRGDLSKENSLAHLAAEFGKALNAKKRGLRSALGGEPDPNALAEATEPHTRGAIMVAAVFDAFLAIYKHRVAPLLRIAANGMRQPNADMHPDLVKRLSAAASDTAQKMLSLVLRALDYCPPVDITFSDYLRALVTADYEYAPDDRTYRIAICEAFRRRGIVAQDTRGISADAIRWPSSRLGFFLPNPGFLNKFSDCWRHGSSRDEIHKDTVALMHEYSSWLTKLPMRPAHQKELGIVLPATGRQRLRVHAMRPTRRITQGHELNLDWVIQITQRSEKDKSFYGGCTLIVDANTGHVRYAIAKDIRDRGRLANIQRLALDQTGLEPLKKVARREPRLRVIEPIVPRALPTPPSRRLRTYAFDPTLSWQLDTAVLNQTTLQIKWEKLERGPVGEYLEVIDYDPASKAFYPAVDLNEQGLLAQDGVAPSEGSPQFHQQMVYAVAMNTIAHFERALGRAVLWSPRTRPKARAGHRRRAPSFVRKLRMYPHALRQPNAYYDAEKKAILFGYFPASADPGRNLPGGMVFTCLSQDIIAHETTHAILDGIHPHYMEPTNADALAFHEAFADIVALFQHFSHAEALSHQIAKTRGDLTRQNLLGELAQQFGEATGRYGALRSAIGQVNPATQQWEPIQPDPAALGRATEPHERGAILVAAVFDTFLTIYKARVTDLIRIATDGTGKLPEGDIHPDLVGRLAAEAGKAAEHVLQMCLRALDYCPPFDVSFGEFLRAIITADYDLLPDDPRSYRIAVIEAFRRRGIHPSDVRTLSQDSLRWSTTDLNLHDLDRSAGKSLFDQVVTGWRLQEDREVIFNRMNTLGKVLGKIIRDASLSDRQQRELGIALGPRAKGVVNVNRAGDAEFEVHSLRRARRISPDGRLKVDLVIELMQTHRRPYGKGEPEWPPFRGGCTLIADPDEGHVRYCISKDIRSVVRLERQRAFLNSPQGLPLQGAYFGDPRRQPSTAGLLAMLHEGEMQ